MLRKTLVTSMASLLAVLGSTAHTDDSPINVLACEPEWAALALELGGKRTNVFSATTALQDAHRVQARPSLIARARNADLLICSGADLEIGWLPVLLRKSGNGAIQPGTIGSVMAADHVHLVGKHDYVDRSMGDIHAAGNPHLATDPRRLLRVAKVVSQRLQQLDAPHSAYYQQRLTSLNDRFERSLQTWQGDIEALNGRKIVVHHDSWAYLVSWLKLNQLATLEPKPGIPPSTGHLSRLLRTLKKNPADIILRASFLDSRPANWLSRKTGTQHHSIPMGPIAWEKKGALLDWYRQMLDIVGS